MNRPTTLNQLSTQRTLVLISLAGLLSLMMSMFPALSLLTFSFRLLITLVHELSHGLAAILTGGYFIRFVVFADGSGLAFTAGGIRLLVIPAGYLGTACFGALLIAIGRNLRWSRLAMAVIGSVMLFCSLWYGLPSIFTVDHFYGGLLTTFSGVILGLIFLIVAFKANPSALVFSTYLIAIQAGLTAFRDLATVIGLSTLLINAPASDAQSMAELTAVPALVWAILWAIIAMLMMGGAIWVSWIRPLQKRKAGGLLPHQPPSLRNQFNKIS